jgi:hypothetical protein
MLCARKTHMETDVVHLDPKTTPAPETPGSPSPSQTNPPPALQRKLQVHSEKFLPLILAFFAILSGVLLFFLFQQLQKKPEPQPPITIIVTPTRAPTPVWYPTNVSTTSAFLDFDRSINEFAAKLNTFERNDPSLSPPSIVLPLGFSK